VTAPQHVERLAVRPAEILEDQVVARAIAVDDPAQLLQIGEPPHLGFQLTALR